nr:hypothetical protein [uncultured Draconibacterium sp.]
MNIHFSFGRAFSFVSIMLFFGLLNLWILGLISFLKYNTVDWSLLVADGGLYFFSVSLVITSALSLFDEKHPKIGTLNFIITLLCAPPVILLSVVTYVYILTENGVDSSGSFVDLWFTQLLCAFTAIIYWIFSCFQTGVFFDK